MTQKNVPWTLSIISIFMIFNAVLMAFIVHRSIETGVASALVKGRIIQSVRSVDPAGFERIVHGLSTIGWASGILGAIGLISIGRLAFPKITK